MGLQTGACGDPGRAKNTSRRQGGFNLIEIMMVLVIAGIMYLIVLPGYQNVVLKSTRIVARTALMELAGRQEQYHVNHKRYATDLASLGLPENFYLDSQNQMADSGSASYRIILDLEDGVYRGATATPVNRQADDNSCGAFSLSRLGVMAVNGTNASRPGACW